MKKILLLTILVHIFLGDMVCLADFGPLVPHPMDYDIDGDLDGSDIAHLTTIFDPAIHQSDLQEMAEAFGFVYPVSPPDDVDLGLPHDNQYSGAGFVGESINIINGNAVEARTDLVFPSPHAQGLQFSAIYNSQSETEGQLGHGWTHNYNLSLDPAITLKDMTFLRISDASGRAHYFLSDGNDTLSGFFNEQSFVQHIGEEYIWNLANGFQYGFSSDGKLSWIDDQYSNRVTINYDGQGRIDTVNDLASGRAISLHYTANGLLDFISGPVTQSLPDGKWVTYDYDNYANLTSIIYGDGSGFTYNYTDPYDIHNLTGKFDTMGHTLTTWSYNQLDQAKGLFSADNSNMTVDYTTPLQPKVTDAYGEIRTYSIEKFGALKRISGLQGTSVTPYGGNSPIRWAYDDQAHLVEVEYPGGLINKYQNFDQNHNPQTIILAANSAEEQTINFTFHPTLRVPLTRSVPSVLGNGNKVTIWDYDSDLDTEANENPTNTLRRVVEQGFTNNQAGEAVFFENITIMSFDSKGQLLSVNGPRPGDDDVTSFTYDPITGDLLSLTKPHLGTSHFVDYNEAGEVGRFIDINNQEQQFSFDGRGRLLTVTYQADGSQISRSFNQGFLKSSTDQDGITHTYDYDAAYGRLETITDPLGNYILLDYDEHGNLNEKGKYTAAGEKTTRLRWDYDHPQIPGLLWKEIQSDDSFSEFHYDSRGNLFTVKDPEGNTTGYFYDLHDRLKQEIRPGNVITTYGYNQFGALNSVIDPTGKETTYILDDMNQVVSTTSSDTGVTSFIYDNAGNLISKTNANTITTNYQYDNLNRLLSIHFPDATENISFSFDEGAYGKGHRTGMTDSSGTTTYHYYPKGKLEYAIVTINGHDFTTVYSYTPGGLLASSTYPSGRVVELPRNSLGKVSEITTTFAGTEQTLISNLDYRPFGDPVSHNTGGNGAVDNLINANSQTTVSNPDSPGARTYQYDKLGRLTSISAPTFPWHNRTYVYDELDRLSEATGYHGKLAFQYDEAGNRKLQTLNDVITNYNYQSDTNRISQISGPLIINFGYDDNGNITSKGDFTFTYNANNRLSRVEQGGTTVSEYIYNGLGQRTSKTTSEGTTLFHYCQHCQEGVLIGESDPAGNFTKEYIYYGTSPLAQVDIVNNKIYHYVNDAKGTPQMMTDDNGLIVWENNYRPFGLANIEDHYSAVNNLRFPGQYYDAESGLHYNWHRYYDPSTGRYLTPDPIGLDGGMNLYLYVGNNPVMFVDPLGLESYSANLFGNSQAGFLNVNASATNDLGVGTLKSSIEGSALHAGWKGSNGPLSGTAEAYKWRTKLEGGITNLRNISSTAKIAAFEGEIKGKVRLGDYLLKLTLGGSAGSAGYDFKFGLNGIVLGWHSFLGAKVGVEWETCK